MLGCNHDSKFTEYADEDLEDEDVFALESIAKSNKEGDEKDNNLQITLIITLKDAMLSLSRVFKIIEVRTFGLSSIARFLVCHSP